MPRARVRAPHASRSSRGLAPAKHATRDKPGHESLPCFQRLKRARRWCRAHLKAAAGTASSPASVTQPASACAHIFIFPQVRAGTAARPPENSENVPGKCSRISTLILRCLPCRFLEKKNCLGFSFVGFASFRQRWERLGLDTLQPESTSDHYFVLRYCICTIDLRHVAVPNFQECLQCRGASASCATVSAVPTEQSRLVIFHAAGRPRPPRERTEEHTRHTARHCRAAPRPSVRRPRRPHAPWRTVSSCS